MVTTAGAQLKISGAAPLYGADTALGWMTFGTSANSLNISNDFNGATWEHNFVSGVNDATTMFNYTMRNSGTPLKVMSIVSNGRVGIGTTAPSVALDAVGTGKVSLGLEVGVASTLLYYCDAGVSAGTLCRGTGCSCAAGAWVSLQIKGP